MSDSPIFIVGLPRSGTTLMRSLVTAHPRIAIAPETHFLRKFGTECDSRDAFERLWAKYSRTPRLRELGLDGEDIRRRIIETGDYSMRNAFQTVLTQFAREQGKERWGEKTPSHYVYTHELLEWFSQGRVIWLVRDPRAICSSLRTVYWRHWELRGLRAVEGARHTRFRRLYIDSKVWERHVRLLRATWSDDARVKIVRYEDLVRDPHGVLGDVGEFLGEDFADDVVTSRSWSDLSTVPPESLSDRRGLWLREHFEQAVRPINQASIDKWKAGLSRLETRLIEGICVAGMKWLGYSRLEDPSEVSLFGRLKVGAARFWGLPFWSIHTIWRGSSLNRTGAADG